MRGIYYLWEMRNTYSSVLVELKQERSVGRLRGEWKDNIKSHFIEVRHEDAEQVRLAQDSSDHSRLL